MFDIKEFLAMSEEAQWNLLENKYGKGSFHSFETLAFRLRDEARKIDLGATLRAGMFAVYNIHHGHGTKWRDTDYKLFRWFATRAKPEHWIAAAIAAKQL